MNSPLIQKSLLRASHINHAILNEQNQTLWVRSHNQALEDFAKSLVHFEAISKARWDAAVANGADPYETPLDPVYAIYSLEDAQGNEVRVQYVNSLLRAILDGTDVVHPTLALILHRTHRDPARTFSFAPTPAPVVDGLPQLDETTFHVAGELLFASKEAALKDAFQLSSNGAPWGPWNPKQHTRSSHPGDVFVFISPDIGQDQYEAHEILPNGFREVRLA